MGIPYDKSVGGKRLRQMRVDRDLTVGQLGALLGRSASSVCCYEHGTMGLSYEMAVRYADVFGMSLDELTAFLSSPSQESEASR